MIIIFLILFQVTYQQCSSALDAIQQNCYWNCCNMQQQCAYKLEECNIYAPKCKYSESKKTNDPSNCPLRKCCDRSGYCASNQEYCFDKEGQEVEPNQEPCIEYQYCRACCRKNKKTGFYYCADSNECDDGQRRVIAAVTISVILIILMFIQIMLCLISCSKKEKTRLLKHQIEQISMSQEDEINGRQVRINHNQNAYSTPSPQ